jgi:hypothetical protein
MIGSHQLLEESLCRGNVTLRAEHELNCASFFIHGAVQILARLPDLDVGFIYPIRRTAHLQMLADTLIDFRGVTLDPTKNS